MPIGEIASGLLEPIFEIIFYATSYFTGAIFLKVVTFGTVKIAPFLSSAERKKKRRKWSDFDWGIYEINSKRLRSDLVCVVGFLVWAALIYGIYLATRDKEADDTSQDVGIEQIEFSEPVTSESDESEYFSIRIEGYVNQTLTFQLEKRYLDSPLITLDHMIDRAKGVTAFGVYLYVIRETPKQIEITKFNVRSVKSGKHEDFKLHDGDLIYIGHRESALNVKQGVELLSTKIQNRINISEKTVRWFAHL